MTRSICTARCQRIGEGMAEGRLDGHPGNLTVRTFQHGESLVLSLWDRAHRIGEGVLHKIKGEWWGTCTECTAEWSVTGKNGHLAFSERTQRGNAR
jgi:hypothetical protein